MDDYDAATTAVLLGEALALIRALGFAGAHVTVIGGLVPTLLVPELDPGMEPHVGSRDVDLCLSIAIVTGDVGSYERIETTVRRSGFKMARNKDGAPESWRWVSERNDRVVVEFFCPPVEGATPGRLFRPGGVTGKNLSALTLGVGGLVDRDGIEKLIATDLPEGKGRVAVRVTGPASFLAAKSDALMRRDKPKDAYDIVWLVEAWPGGPERAAQDVSESRIANDTQFVEAMETLADQFSTLDSLGAKQYARFVSGGSDTAARRAVGAVSSFTAALAKTRNG